MYAEDLSDRLLKIKLLILDVDGVLTDGSLLFDAAGQEIKQFDVKDGHGIILLQRAGIPVALLTGRCSTIVERRAAELKILHVMQGVADKSAAYETLKGHIGLEDEDIAYVGDDVVDLPVLRQVGCAIAVHDAVTEVKAVAQYITSHPGGKGAVREVAELILKTQNHWEHLMQRYYH